MYPRDAGVMNLLEKLLKRTSAFVVHPRFRKQLAFISVLKTMVYNSTKIYGSNTFDIGSFFIMSTNIFVLS